MKTKIIYIKGDRIGSLVFVKELKTIDNVRWALLKCHCNNQFKCRIHVAKSGNTKSCGCARKITLSKKFKTHGLTESTEYSIWTNMKTRCYNTQSTYYKHYGGRGILICDEWRHNFNIFLKDMGKRPGDKFSIDRIDNNKGYCKENCRWVTKTQQGNNKRNNEVYIFNGKLKTIAQWASYSNIPYKRLWKRLRVFNWGIQEALMKS